MMSEAAIILKPGREKSLLQRHPWVFSGAIARAEGNPKAGETVLLKSDDQTVLGRAAWSPHSSIAARVWTWDADEVIDRSFFLRRIQKALQTREIDQLQETTDAFRLIHAESDGLPGFIVDRYGDILVLQSLTCGSEYWKDVFVDCLTEICRPKSVYERSDMDVRLLEGLLPQTGLLWGEEIPEKLTVSENGIAYWVDVRRGHKTGFYLDQRINRRRLMSLAKDRTVLNCFCYSGGFSLAAQKGGAAGITSVDSSRDALDLAQANWSLNHFDSQTEWIEADVFDRLRKFRDQNRRFDLIVLDPPKFAPTLAQVERAARGYKDINLLAFRLLNPGGLLMTFSCSGGVSAELFRKIVAGAALDAGVNAVVLERLAQSPDHPVSLMFPEGEYLKGLVIRVE